MNQKAHMPTPKEAPDKTLENRVETLEKQIKHLLRDTEAPLADGPSTEKREQLHK
jgi:hypothetical protein